MTTRRVESCDVRTVSRGGGTCAPARAATAGAIAVNVRTAARRTFALAPGKGERGVRRTKDYRWGRNPSTTRACGRARRHTLGEPVEVAPERPQ
jgi:hypothetical protein